MRSYKILLAVLLLALLMLVPLTACGGSSGEDETTGSAEDQEGEPTEAPETELVLAPVASTSLGSADAVEAIGVKAGDVIVAAEGCYAGGAVYRGLNDQGRRIWEVGQAELWPFSHEEQIPSGFPTVFVNAGDTIEVINNGDFDIVDDYYMEYLSGEVSGTEVPTEAGVYVRMITVENPRPGASDPDPELGALFGEWYYFVVVVVE